MHEHVFTCCVRNGFYNLNAITALTGVVSTLILWCPSWHQQRTSFQRETFDVSASTSQKWCM